MQVERLSNNLAELRAVRDEVFELVRDAWDAFDVPRDVLRGMSGRQVEQCLMVAEELFRSLEHPFHNEVCLLLTARAFEINAAIDSVKQHLIGCRDKLLASLQEGTQISDIDGAGHLSLEKDGVRYSEVNLVSEFKAIGQGASTLVIALSQISALCTQQGFLDFTGRATEFTRLVNEVQKHYKEAKAYSARSKVAASKTEKLIDDIEGLKQSAEAHITKIQESLNQSNRESGQATALTEQVRVIAASAEKLSESVSQYQARFEAFQGDLDKRIEALGVFDQKSKAADERNDKYESEIKRLIEEAKGMLSTATTAGLASSMEITRKRYQNRMLSATIGFALSIILLMVCALPLAAHLVPGLVELLPFMSDSTGKFPLAVDADKEGSVFAVLGKVLLLLPATWLTAFMTKTFANLFQLEREYAHKAALAGAVHGFKLQAPTYEEEITAEVFREVLNNPARAPIVDSASHPLHDILARVVDVAMKRREASGS